MMDQETLSNIIKPIVEQKHKKFSVNSFVAEGGQYLVFGIYEQKDDDIVLTVERITTSVTKSTPRDINKILDLPDSELSFMEKKAIEKAKGHA